MITRYLATSNSGEKCDSSWLHGIDLLGVEDTPARRKRKEKTSPISCVVLDDRVPTFSQNCFSLTFPEILSIFQTIFGNCFQKKYHSRRENCSFVCRINFKVLKAKSTQIVDKRKKCYQKKMRWPSPQLLTRLGECRLGKHCKRSAKIKRFSLVLHVSLPEWSNLLFGLWYVAEMNTRSPDFISCSVRLIGSVSNMYPWFHGPILKPKSLRRSFKHRLTKPQQSKKILEWNSESAKEFIIALIGRLERFSTKTANGRKTTFSSSLVYSQNVYLDLAWLNFSTWNGFTILSVLRNKTKNK